MKYCSQCKELKTLDDFHKYKHNNDGRHSICKLCRSKYNKQLRYKRPKNGRMKCNSCNIIKEVSEFYTDSSSSSGLQTYCKSCLKEKIYESQSKLENYISKIYNKFKQKYKEKTKFTKEDLLKLYKKQNGRCAFTKELLTYYTGPSLTLTNYESKFNICISIDNTNELNVNAANKNIEINCNHIELIGNIVHKMKNNLNNKEFFRLCKLISQKEEPLISQQEDSK